MAKMYVALTSDEIFHIASGGTVILEDCGNFPIHLVNEMTYAKIMANEGVGLDEDSRDGNA